jgi:uncharacterized protein YggU (UPF0235/DUF167 family)
VAGTRQAFDLFQPTGIKNKTAFLELIELLSQKFKVPKSQIAIKSGQNSRQKIIEIMG